MIPGIEWIQEQGVKFAVIIRHSFQKEGLEFITPDEFPLQIGYMNRPKDYIISPHVHHAYNRELTKTYEVLYIKSGKVKTNFFTQDKQYVSSTVLYAGDVILLAEGGHGFEMLEPTEIIEVKQGPYAGTEDKEKFDPKGDTHDSC